MELYSKYIKERENRELIEVPHGFITYQKLDNGDIYIVDLFVEKEFRRSGIGTQLSELVKQAALKDGVKRLIGSICLTTNGVTNSMKSLITDGFTYSHASGTMLYFVKEI